MDPFSTLTGSLEKDRIAAAQYRALLASSPLGMVAVDRAGIIQLANHSAEALFGYSPGELVGQVSKCWCRSAFARSTRKNERSTNSVRTPGPWASGST